MSYKRILPLFDRVLIRKVAPPSKTVGGIVLPDDVVKKGSSQQGEVLAVGTGLTTKDGTVVPPVLAAGDKVYLSEYSGTEIELDGEKLSLYREDDILAVIKDK
mmetsp:Transcript_10936/g.16391  ORF Transcript_10936/g.16391 Transcript_10936/m.16391 type:complete len:103 (+) Transcript_10936:21-329(+)